MASLPPYEEIVRWTVADTTRWLAENNLDEFKDPFKKQGVDGSKLAKLTDTDIDAFKVASTKKRIQLKNAVSNIDRSRLNSLPRTQGMMSTFRNMPSEPVPPPRPPKRQSFPVEPAPPPPSSRHAGYNDDDDDAYSWGDEFDYQSDPEDQDLVDVTAQQDVVLGQKDYINEQQWTPQDHDNTRYDQEETYEAVDDDDDYEEPANPPEQLGRSGTILEKLQAELTRRGTLKGSKEPPVADNSDDSSDDDYVQPQEAPPAPSRRQQPVPKPPERDAPPRPKPAHRSAPPPPPVEDEDVYEEPEEELVVTKREEKEKNKKARQLPPVPPIPTDDRPPLPPPTAGRKSSRPPPPLPKDEQEVYEPMDQGELSRGSKVPAPRKASHPPPPDVSGRPLPNVPSPTEKPERKARSRNGVPPSPKQDELDQFDWYHKNIERQAAEARLMEAGEDGMYLIRKSKRGGTEQQYTLTIYKQGRVYNLPIRKRNSDGKFALGAAKPNELDFDTVSGLVDYFKKQLIKLNPNAKNAAGSTRLVIPLSK